MSRPTRHSYRQIASRSSLVTPSPYYIGWWPMNQLVDDGSGGRTYNKVTLANATTVSLTSDWYEHADVGTAVSAGWLYAGAPIKTRFTGNPPTGLLNSVLYYADLTGGANRVRFALTAAAAIAGSAPVDLHTSVGTGNTVIFPAHVTDYSGQGNHMVFGASCHDTVAFGDIGVKTYMASATNATNDQSIGVLPVATLNARWNWPNYSLLFIASMMMTAAMSIPTRGIVGCGSGGTSDGPRMQTAAVTDGKFSVTMRHGGSGASTAPFNQTAAAPFVEDVEVHIAWLFDANAMFGHVWINGYLDRNAQYDIPTGFADLVVTPAIDWRFGGCGPANCQAMGFRDVHLLSIPSSVAFHMPTLNDMILALSGGPGYRFRDGDF